MGRRSGVSTITTFSSELQTEEVTPISEYTYFEYAQPEVR